MINTPIYNGLAQSDLDFAGFNALNMGNMPTGGSGSGGGIPVTNIKDAPYNAAGNGVTDDTAALQAAINALWVLGGGRIYFPPGTYLIGGALQETSGRNAQILLPIVPISSPGVTIELVGALSPPTQYYIGTPLPSGTAYSVIKSTLTGATGSASFIAGKENGSDFWDNVQLIVRNLIFQAPPDPSFTVFNCFNIMGPQFERVLIHTGSIDINTITQPTNSNSVAIKLAPSEHSASQRISGADVFGFYTGMQDGELGESYINFWGCKQAVLAPWSFHLSTFRNLGIFNCQLGIVAAGAGYTGLSGDDGTHYMRVFACAVEHSNSGAGSGQAWQDRVYDVQDPSNLLVGDVKQLSILAASGRDYSFTKNGGTKLLVTQIGEDAVYIGSDARLVSISGGVKLEVRNTGTGTWVEATRYTNP